ncbi:MAG: DUF4913 domain-containing protein [Pseudonocardiaceae bacterium]
MDEAEPEPAGQQEPEHDDLAARYYRLAGEHAVLTARMTAVENKIEDYATVFDELEAAVNAFTAEKKGEDDAAAKGPATEPERFDLRRLVDWVRENVALLIQRQIPQTGGMPHWCRSWWLHPEAIARFQAAYLSWKEASRSGEGNAMVVYFEHLDHQLNVLCGQNGPFQGCTNGRHQAGSRAAALGQVEPGEDYFLQFEVLSAGGRTA